MSEHSLDSLSFISTASSEEFDPAPRNIGGVEVKYVSKPVKFDIIEYMMSPKQPNTKPAEEQIFASTSKFPVMNGRSLDLWNVSEQEVKERVNKEYTKGPQNDADVKSLKITKPLPESGVSPKSASLAGTFLEFHTNYKIWLESKSVHGHSEETMEMIAKDKELRKKKGIDVDKKTSFIPRPHIHTKSTDHTHTKSADHRSKKESQHTKPASSKGI